MSITQLRDAIRENLRALFSTANLAAVDATINSSDRALCSVINFGVPAIVGMSFSESSLRTLQDEVARAVQTFEPRLNPETLLVRLREGDPDAREGEHAIVLELEGEIAGAAVPIQLAVRTVFDADLGLGEITVT